MNSGASSSQPGKASKRHADATSPVMNSKGGMMTLSTEEVADLCETVDRLKVECHRSLEPQSLNRYAAVVSSRDFTLLMKGCEAYLQSPATIER